MHPDTLALLRCPLDPERAATLTQDRDILTCQGCKVRYPIKQGLPVLVVSECELPEGTTELSQLPCQRRRERRRG
jgi:uncharacterized protein